MSLRELRGHCVARKPGPSASSPDPPAVRWEEICALQDWSRPTYTPCASLHLGPRNLAQPLTVQTGTSGPRSKVTGPHHCTDQRERGLALHQAQGQTFPRSQCIRRGPNISAAGHPAPSSQALFLAEEHLGPETRSPEARLEPAKGMSLPEPCPPPVGSVHRGQVCSVP